MNFTREPIVETVITPKEGYKLVVRNSKGEGQEEFFVDAIEVISFGSQSFYRSLEKPKCFLVPVNDYEVLEVREARIVLKTVSLEKGVKIGGGRESTSKSKEKEMEVALPSSESVLPPITEPKVDKKRERRKFRKKKGKSDQSQESEEEQIEAPTFREIRPSLIPPPPKLISESLVRRARQSTDELPLKENQDLESSDNPRSREEESKESDISHSKESKSLESDSEDQQLFFNHQVDE